jgi:hypothetical protein
MAMYGIITKITGPGNTTTWRFVGPPGSHQPDQPNPVQLLNLLGNQGWDVVGVGDFGAGEGDEIIMRK